MKFLKIIGVALISVSLSACVNSFNSDVTSFHQLPASKGETVSIVPIDPAKKGSLEFQAYAAKVGAELTKLGYKPAQEAKPDLVVGLDYGINDGREKIYANPFPARYWQSWSGYGYWHRYDPFYSMRRMDDEISTKTVYKTTLNLEFRHPDGKKLYEGRAESETRSNSLPVVVPKLVKALFQTFPGPSGQTVRVVVQEEK